MLHSWYFNNQQGPISQFSKYSWQNIPQCTILYGVLWDMRLVHYGICWTGLLSEYVYANLFDNIFGMTDYVNISVIDILVSKDCI